MNRRKYKHGDEISPTVKIVTTEVRGGLNDFRKRYVGWIPFLAFWANIYIFSLLLNHEDNGRWTSGLGATLLYLAWTIVCSFIFFAMAALQCSAYKNTPGKSRIPAVIALFLHGAVLVCFVIGIAWLILES